VPHVASRRIRLGSAGSTRISRTSVYEAALRDPLTRAYNRRYFDDRLFSELSFARRHGAPLGLLMVDLDHFKRINDVYGHQAGDVVLRVVAATIQRLMRPEDVVARYGGDEFVVIARGTTLRNAEILAERSAPASNRWISTGPGGSSV
jgi:diguanylate cyclase (GGDEF)-like protein